MSNEDLQDDYGAFIGYNPFDNEPATPEEFMEFVCRRIEEYKSSTGYIPLPATWKGIDDTTVSNVLTRMCATASTKPYSGTTKLFDGVIKHTEPLDGVSLLSPYRQRASTPQRFPGMREYSQLLDTLIKQAISDISMLATAEGVNADSVRASYTRLRKAANELDIDGYAIHTITTTMLIAPDVALTAIIEETTRLAYSVANLIGTATRSYDEMIKNMHANSKGDKNGKNT